jgi:YVTN family beta-propeller protein
MIRLHRFSPAAATGTTASATTASATTASATTALLSLAVLAGCSAAIGAGPANQPAPPLPPPAPPPAPPSAPVAQTAPVPQPARDSGRLLVVNKAEATLSVVDVAAGRELTRVPTGNAPHEVAVSPDGRTAVVTNYGTGQQPGNTLTVIDLVALVPTATIDLGAQRRPHGIAYHPDGRRVVVTTEGNGTLTVVDVAARRVEAAIATGANVSHEVALTPDGGRAFVANIGSGSVTVIDIERAEVVRTIPTGRGAEGVAVTPDGSQVWVSNRAENTVTVIDARSLDVLATLPSADFPIRVVFTTDGRRGLVTNARSAELRVFDVATRAELAAVPITAPAAEPGRAQVIAFEGSASPIGVLGDPDGRHVYVAAASADAVAVVDLERGAVVRLIPVGREPDGLAWAPAPR